MEIQFFIPFFQLILRFVLILNLCLILLASVYINFLPKYKNYNNKYRNQSTTDPTSTSNNNVNANVIVNVVDMATNSVAAVAEAERKHKINKRINKRNMFIDRFFDCYSISKNSSIITTNNLGTDSIEVIHGMRWEKQENRSTHWMKMLFIIIFPLFNFHFYSPFILLRLILFSEHLEWFGSLLAICFFMDLEPLKTWALFLHTLNRGIYNLYSQSQWLLTATLLLGLYHIVCCLIEIMIYFPFDCINSGLVLSYLFFQTEKKKKKQSPIIKFVSSVVNRYLRYILVVINTVHFQQFVVVELIKISIQNRLTPPYLVAILFTGFTTIFLRNASIYWMIEPNDVNCQQYWWRNILYIQNMYPLDDMCMSWSWFLAADFQCFCLTSFLLVIYTK